MQTNAIDNIPPLTRGSHDDLSAGACMLEAAAYVAGETWSDHPQCVCPVIAAFCRTYNDILPDDTRDELLRPLIPLLIGTRATPELEQARAYMVADWACRVAAPAALRAARLDAHADTLERLTPLISISTARAAAAHAAHAAHAARAAAHAADAPIYAINAAAHADDATYAAADAATHAANAADTPIYAINTAAHSAARSAARAVNPADVVGLIHRMIGASL